jgi:hypothetical protein
VSAGSYAQKVAVEQRKRLVGSVMAMVERDVYPHLPADVRTAFRNKLLQSVGVYHDFVLDSLKAAIEDSDTTLNEAVIEALGELANETRMLRELREG